MRIRAKLPSFRPQDAPVRRQRSRRNMCPQDWTLEGLLCSARGAKTPRTKSCSLQVNGSKFQNEIPLKKKIFFFLLSSTFLQQDNLTLGVLFCFFPFFSSFLLKCDCCSKFCMSREKQHQSICLKALCSQPCMTPGLQHITILPHSKEGARHMLNSQHTP